MIVLWTNVYITLDSIQCSRSLYYRWVAPVFFALHCYVLQVMVSLPCWDHVTSSVELD